MSIIICFLIIFYWCSNFSCSFCKNRLAAEERTDDLFQTIFNFASNLGPNGLKQSGLLSEVYADTIKSPVLMIHGEKAHSRYFSEDAFKKLTGDNKELMIIPNANHTDLYYKMDVIPFDKIEQFFKDNLK